MEAFDQLRSLAQRTMSAAHQVDEQLELPETADLVGAGRAFMAALDQVGARLKPMLTAAVAALETVPEAPLAVGDQVVVRVGLLDRLARITGEGAGGVFVLEWRLGTFTAPARDCRRAQEGK